jgi:hypothetical protein
MSASKRSLLERESGRATLRAISSARYIDFPGVLAALYRGRTIGFAHPTGSPCARQAMPIALNGNSAGGEHR